MKRIITIISLICCMLNTGCSLTNMSSINTLADEVELVEEIQQVEVAEVIEPFEFGVVDTLEFGTITTDEYEFLYNPDIWNAYAGLEISSDELVDACVVLENDIVKIIGSNISYLSNTTAKEYFELIIATIPSMPLTGVEIISTTTHQVGELSVALIETSAGFTKEDIETLIYKQVLTHENVNAMGGLNNLDYKPILSQFLLIICDDTKAYTFAASFSNNPNSSYFNSYYKNITLQAFDGIVQTINTNIKTYDK